MKRMVTGLCLVGAVAGRAVGAAGTVGATGTIRTDDLTARAKTSVMFIVKEDFKGFLATCDSAVKAGLPEAQLKSLWQSLLAQTGAFKSVGGVKTSAAGQYDVATVTCLFENGPLDIQLAYDKAGLVSGLHFLPVDQSSGNQPSGYQPPAYAKPELFHEKPATVGSGPWALPGTLTLPNGPGPFPAVVLVHGSGPQDRDESIGPNKPFADLAWGLASRGIAVLRYEKRTKQYADKLLADKDKITVKEEVVDDAVAAVATLRGKSGIDPKRIFVLGHSLGGTLVPMIGKADPAIAGFVVMAGATRPLEDLVLDQVTYLLGLDTLSADDESQLAELKKQVARVKDPQLSTKVPAADLPLGAPAAYWLSLRGYHPAEAARSLTRPILILQGGRDYQVTSVDFDGWKKTRSGRTNVTLTAYPALNHLFMEGTAKSTPDEYGQPGHVAERVIEDIAGWMKK